METNTLPDNAYTISELGYYILSIDCDQYGAVSSEFIFIFYKEILN